MTVQVPIQQQQQGWRRGRLIPAGLVVVLLIGIAAIWIANLGSVLAGVLSIVCALLGILIAFLQWWIHPQRPAQVQAGGIATDEQGQQQFYEQIEGLTLDVNKRKGALIIYTRKHLRGSSVNLSFGFHSSPPKVDLASGVIGRKRKGGTINVAVFCPLEPGSYTTYTDSWEFVTKVNILAGRVVEVDWR